MLRGVLLVVQKMPLVTHNMLNTTERALMPFRKGTRTTQNSKCCHLFVRNYKTAVPQTYIRGIVYTSNCEQPWRCNIMVSESKLYRSSRVSVQQLLRPVLTLIESR